MFKRGYRAVSLVLTLLLLCSFLAGALAEGKLVPIMQLYAGQKSYYQLNVVDMPYNAKLISAKSSNPKVIAVKTGMKEKNDIVVKGLKVGTATITVKYKAGGKTYTVKDTLTVKKFPKVFQSLKVAGKTVNLSKDVAGYTLKKFKKTSAKLDIVPAKGWEIGSIWGFAGSKQLNITNHKSFSIPKKSNAYISIEMYNSDNEYVYYEININR